MRSVKLSLLTIYLVIAPLIVLLAFLSFYDYWSLLDVLVLPGGAARFAFHPGVDAPIKAITGIPMLFLGQYIDMFASLSRDIIMLVIDHSSLNLLKPVQNLVGGFLLVSILAVIFGESKKIHISIFISIFTAVLAGALLARPVPTRADVIASLNRASHEKVTAPDLTSLLRAGRYDELSDRLAKLHDNYVNHTGDVDEYINVIKKLKKDIKLSDLQYCNAWIAKKPGDANALLIRGWLYLNEGFDARGTKYADNTSHEQFAAMQKYFDKSAADMESVLKIDPGSLYAYVALIKITSAGSYHVTKQDLYAQALKNAGPKYELAHAYANKVLRRWGGYPGEIQDIASSMRPYVENDPRFVRLSSIQLWDHAQDAYSSNKDTALRYYKLALLYGATEQEYQDIINIYQNRKDDRKEQKWVGRCINELPTAGLCYGDEIAYLVSHKSYSRAGHMAEKLSQIPDLTNWEIYEVAYGFASSQQYANAQLYYLKYLDRYPNNDSILRYLYGLALRGFTDKNAVLPYFKKIVDTEPDNFDVLIWYAELMRDRDPAVTRSCFEKILKNANPVTQKLYIKTARDELAEMSGVPSKAL